MASQVNGQAKSTLKTLQKLHGQVTGRDKRVTQTFIKTILTHSILAGHVKNGKTTISQAFKHHL